MKKRERKSWADLPQDILALILAKLVNAVHIIPFRAVCKNWHTSKDRMINCKAHGNLPWFCNISWSKDNPDFLECEMYDPFSRQMYVTSKFVESRRYTRSYCKTIKCLGTKQGWLIATYNNHFIKSEIFMYNPYTKEFISLPFIWTNTPCFATFSGNRVFVLSSNGGYPCHHYIDSCGLDGDKEWETASLGATNKECCGMHYVNEQLFCLFWDGSMIRYSLADGSSTTLLDDVGSEFRRLWLAKGDGDLLVACELGYDYRFRTECSTWYFDWSSMSWVRSDLQESCGIFISGSIATFVRPFEDVENERNCKVYFFREKGCEKEPSNYSFAEIMKRVQCSPSAVFIEPPLF